MFHRSRENDQRFGSPKALKFVYELIQFIGTVEHAFQQHGVISCYAITFNDIETVLNIGIEFLFIYRCYFQIDKRTDMIAEGYRIHFCMIATDIAQIFQITDSCTVR